MASATLIAGHPAALASSQATQHTSKHRSLSARHATSFHGSLLARPAISAASATAQQQRGARLQVNARCGPSNSWGPSAYRMPGFYGAMRGSPALQQWQKQAQQAMQEAAQQQGLWFPIDVLESDKQYQYVADVPGLGKSDIKVQVDKERVLTISGERTFKEAATSNSDSTTEQASTSSAVDVTDSTQDAQQQQQPQWRRTRKERRFGSFKRSWTLPEDAELTGISARVEKGVLTLTVNRVQPVEPEVTTININ